MLLLAIFKISAIAIKTWSMLLIGGAHFTNIILGHSLYTSIYIYETNSITFSYILGFRSYLSVFGAKPSNYKEVRDL